MVAANAQETQETFDSLTVGDVTYTNVTVVTRTDTHISFTHAHGFSTVKLTALDPASQMQVGYTPPPPPKTVMDRTKELSERLNERFTEHINDPRLLALEKEIRAEVDRVMAEDDKVILYSVLGGVAAIYILFCLAAVKICRKTTVRPGLWVWLPGFQWISLFKAAGMSPWNFILLFLPPINLIVMMVWCFKICRTRQKSQALGFLLLIPVINIFVYFYLAFSSQKNAPANVHPQERLRLSFQP